jgi:hypothetical protein
MLARMRASRSIRRCSTAAPRPFRPSQPGASELRRRLYHRGHGAPRAGGGRGDPPEARWLCARGDRSESADQDDPRATADGVLVISTIRGGPHHRRQRFGIRDDAVRSALSIGAAKYQHYPASAAHDRASQARTWASHVLLDIWDRVDLLVAAVHATDTLEWDLDTDSVGRSTGARARTRAPHRDPGLIRPFRRGVTTLPSIRP